LKSDSNEQTRIRAYLLGRMAEADLSDLEERLLVDAEFYEELSIVEEELIEEYLRSELLVADRQSFETHFMAAPERREKLRFARALNKHVNAIEASHPHEDAAAESPLELATEVAKPPPKQRRFFSFLPFQSPIVSYALAAAILLVVAGISWVAWKNWNPTGTGKVLAVELAPALTTRDVGDAEIKKFAIPPDTETVRLQLDLPKDEYLFYEAALLDSNLRTLATNKNLKAQSANGRSSVFIDEIASSLPPGDYRIRLSGRTVDGGAESVAGYSFRVVR
jgi:hypothetical protein